MAAAAKKTYFEPGLHGLVFQNLKIFARANKIKFEEIVMVEGSKKLMMAMTSRPGPEESAKIVKAISHNVGRQEDGGLDLAKTANVTILQKHFSQGLHWSL